MLGVPVKRKGASADVHVYYSSKLTNVLATHWAIEVLQVADPPLRIDVYYLETNKGIEIYRACVL